MNATAMPPRLPSETLRLRLCGSCAADFMAACPDFERPSMAVLSLSNVCELHPGAMAPQATNVLEGPLGEESYAAVTKTGRVVSYVAADDQVRELRPGAPPSPSDVRDLLTGAPPLAQRMAQLQESFPPSAPWSGLLASAAPIPSLTEVAMRLLCAWTANDIAKADSVTIGAAVDTAREIKAMCGE